MNVIYCISPENELYLYKKWWEVVTKWLKVVETTAIDMFMGEYNHTIDGKGRLIVPAKFREALGDVFVVTKGLDGCLFVYDKKSWEEFETKLQSLPLMNKEARKFVRFFQSGANEVEVDKQGRILLPVPLREYAALGKDVVLIGMAGRVEIWSKERFDQESTYDDMDDVAEQLEKLGLSI